MGFRFVHTADWQIGRAFRNFEPALAGLLEDARLDCIDQIAAVARSGGARHVLVAGDVYDSPDLATKTLRQLLERMKAQPDQHWWLLPGNHDPARAGGVWDRIAALGTPDNVTPILTPGARELSPGVCLLAAPLTAKSVAVDPTRWMDACETPAGAIRIGLAHGSIQHFGRDDVRGVDGIIDPARARLARLDYLALGDWHGTTQINARTWYSGTPEPDRFRDNEAGHVLMIGIDGPGAAPIIARHRTARYAWLMQSSEITDAEALMRVEEQVLAGISAPAATLVQLALTGRLSASAHADLAEWRDRLDAKLRYLEVDTSALSVTVEGDDIAAFGADLGLRDVALRLADFARDEGGPHRETAKAALAKLFELTRRIGGGGGTS